VEGRSCDLFQSTILAFALKDREKPQKKPVSIVRGLPEGMKSTKNSGYYTARNFMINVCHPML
jgi:hypothetical protein